MNDNKSWPETRAVIRRHRLPSILLGIAWRAAGLLIVVGSIIAGIWYPNPGWMIPGIVGAVMVII